MGEAESEKTAPEGYRYDSQGQLIHEVYDEGGHADIGIKGTVIPSAKKGGSVGGNIAYDPHSVDIPQNIVECTDDGMKVIAKTTRAEMAEKQGVSAQPAQEVPAATSFQGEAPRQFMGGALGRLNISLGNRGGDMAKKKKAAKAKAKTKKTSRRVEKSPEPAPEAMLVPVTISGIFGRIVQPFSAVFRDGNLVVLATDHRQLTTAYQFPKLSDGEPIPMQIEWGGQTVKCLWAGLKFDLPDRTVSFTLLLVNEEPQDEQGLPSQTRQNEV